jgi:hypothetical protein
MPLLVSPTAKQGIHHQTIGSMMQVSWNRSSSNDVGAIVRQCCCSRETTRDDLQRVIEYGRRWAGNVAVSSLYFGSRLNSKGATSRYQKGPFALAGDGKGPALPLVLARLAMLQRKSYPLAFDERATAE